MLFSDSVWQRSEADWRDEQQRARDLGLGISSSQAQEVAATARRQQILGPKIRRQIADAAARLNPINGRTAQAKWDRLLALATAKPGSLGFVPVGDHGTTSLALKLSTSSGNVSTMLARLEGDGLIVTYGRWETARRPRLVAVQVPLLTDALVWLAQRRYWDLSKGGPANTMRSVDALNLACECLARRSAPPQHLVTQADAENYLRRLRRRPPN